MEWSYLNSRSIVGLLRFMNERQIGNVRDDHP